MAARAIFCAKGACVVTGYAGGTITGMLAADSILVNNNRQPYFAPRILPLLEAILPAGALPNTPNLDKENEKIEEGLTELTATQAEQVALSKIQETITTTKALSEEEVEEFVNILESERDNLGNKEKFLKSKIKEEIDKLKRK